MKKLFVLFVTCLFLCDLSAQNNEVNAAIDSFAVMVSANHNKWQDTVYTKNFTHSRWAFLRPFVDKNLLKVRTIKFKYSGTDKGFKNTWFNVYVLEFANQKRAEELYKIAASKAYHDSIVMFSKDYDFVLHVNNYVVKLDGPCLYSGKNWALLKRKFVVALEKVLDFKAIVYVECLCGGQCVEMVGPKKIMLD